MLAEYSSHSLQVSLTIPSRRGIAGWTSKVCQTAAFWAVFKGSGPIIYILLGSTGLTELSTP